MPSAGAASTRPAPRVTDNRRVETLFDDLMPVHYGFVNLVHGEVDAALIGAEEMARPTDFAGRVCPGSCTW